MTTFQLIISVVVGLLAVANAFVLLFTALVSTRIEKGVKEVHLLVNDRLDKAIARYGQLAESLRAKGYDVPEPEEAD